MGSGDLVVDVSKSTDDAVTAPTDDEDVEAMDEIEL